MNTPQWTKLVSGKQVLERPDYRGQDRVWSFLGGADHILIQGKAVRDTRRNPMCDFLNKHGGIFYDTQIFLDSHGRTRKKLDEKADKKARLEASLTVYPVWDLASAEVARQAVNDDLQYLWDVMHQKLIVVWWYDELLVEGKLPEEYESIKKLMRSEIQATQALGFEEAKKQVMRAVHEHIAAFTT